MVSKSRTTQEYFAKYLTINDTGDYISFFTGQETVFPNYLEPINDVEDSQIGVFVTGVVVEPSSSSYAVAFNPLTIDWTQQLLSGVILNRNRYLEYSKAFGKYNFHKVLYYKYQYFVDKKLLTISPKTRIRLKENSLRLNNHYPEGIDRLIQEIQSNPYLSFDEPWCNDLLAELRSGGNNTHISSNGEDVLKFVYQRLRLPSFLKNYLKKFVLFILRY